MFTAGTQLLPSKAHRPHVCSQLLGVLNCSQTAEVSKPADELQRSSSQVKCSSRTHTYTEGSLRRSCVRRAAKIKKPSPYSFLSHLPSTCHLKSLDILETSSHWSTLAETRNGRLALFLFLLLHIWSVFCFSFLGEDMLSPLSSCHLPAERRPTSAHTQPDPSRCPWVGTGEGGAEQARGWGGKSHSGLGGHYLLADAWQTLRGGVCQVQVFQQEKKIIIKWKVFDILVRCTQLSMFTE